MLSQCLQGELEAVRKADARVRVENALVHLTRGLPHPPLLPSVCSFCAAAAHSLFFLLTLLSGLCPPSGAGSRQGLEHITSPILLVTSRWSLPLSTHPSSSCQEQDSTPEAVRRLQIQKAHLCCEAA